MKTKQLTPANQAPSQKHGDIPTPAVFTEIDAAQYLSISPQFLRLSRHYGNRIGHAEGPPFIRLGGGRAIRYLKSDLDA